MRKIAFAFLFTLGAAQAQAPEQIEARVLCRGDEVAAIQMSVPHAGVITVQIPPGVCRSAKSV